MRGILPDKEFQAYNEYIEKALAEREQRTRIGLPESSENDGPGVHDDEDSDDDESGDDDIFDDDEDNIDRAVPSESEAEED